MTDQMSGSNGNHGVVLEMKDNSNTKEEIESTFFSFPFIQKLIAEVFGTYFLIFAGCGSVAVNLDYDKVVTLPGISIVWGLAVMVLVYSVGHISGAHFNPAVTIAFATCKRLPWKQVPPYILAQVLGSTLANGTLRLLFTGKLNHFLGTQPAGSDVQAFVFEFIITFYLMFVISGVATDNRAIGELAGLAVGATVLLNVMFAGNGSIYESGKELGSGDSVSPLRQAVDLHRGTNNRGDFRGMDLQPDPIHRQAHPRDHQVRLFPPRAELFLSQNSFHPPTHPLPHPPSSLSLSLSLCGQTCSAF
ncbi:aquaporin NIP1-1 isoform X1 [Eucalyptus grandis]|uniref:aquaporin NIP1-1 isoform X1 n=1 Tax=Eucalyptus grandis TaxID=71139 RepID=UPI00192EEFE0|nr:aquaporin NIP1-1 isoform X1 [Eucalyptus grandis]